jgi:hypothetical protein
MSWEIVLPVRSPADPFDPTDIADDIAEAISDPEERAVTRAVVLELALEPGIETMGDALDAVENADQPTRRRLLDAAREQTGLPPTSKVEAMEAANRPTTSSLPPRDSDGRIEARCSAPTCLRYAPDPSFPGVAAKVMQRKWFCGEHAHLAAPGDDQPYRGPRLVYGPAGTIVDLDEQEAEAERQRVQTESRRRQREAHEAERAEDARALAKYEAAAAERFRREHIK